MKQLLNPSNATFNAVAKTITFATTIPTSVSHILHVTNVTRGVIYFQPQAGALFTGTYASPVLTLACSTSGHADADKLEIFYDDGVAIGSLASGTGVNGEMVAIGATEFYFSTANTTTAQLAAAATFTGTIESIINAQAISVGLTSDQNGTLTLIQYIDAGGTRTISSWPFTVVAGTPFSRAFTANGNYFRLTFTNNGGSTTTTLNINTAFGTLPAVTNLGFAPVSLNEIGGTALTAGRKTSANSIPFVLPSDQSAIPVSNPLVLVSPTTNTLTAAGTVQATIVAGGAYTFCISCTSTLGATANTLASCTTAIGSKTVTYTGSAPSVGQLLAGTGITPGSYVVSVSAGVNFVMSLPATAAGTVTLNVTAGSFAGTFQSSPDGSNWSNVNVTPLTFATNSAQTNSFVAPGLFLYASTHEDRFLRFNLTSVSSTGVLGNLSVGPTIRFNIDALDRSGGVVNLPYFSYIAATAATFPTGIPLVMPINTSLMSEITIDVNTLTGTSQSAAPRISSDDNGSLFQVGTIVSGISVTSAPAASFTAAGMYKANVSAKYFYVSFTAGTAVATQLIGGVTARLGTTASNQTVNATAMNLSSISGNSIAGYQPNGAGSNNRVMAVFGTTALSNTDQSATAFAGAGRVNGTLVASTAGGGSCISAEINVGTLTLGSATSVLAILQESNGGTNFTDIWVSDPITTTGIRSMPAIPIGGRRRWCFHSVGGTSTTVTVTINAFELQAGYVKQAQFRDAYSATNPLATVINSTTQTASTFGATTALTATTQATSWFAIQGCSNITGFMTLAGSPTVTTQPVVSLEVSNDTTNGFLPASSSMTAAGNGTYAVQLSNIVWRYARLRVTTAAAYSAGAYTISAAGIQGVN